MTVAADIFLGASWSKPNQFWFGSSVGALSSGTATCQHRYMDSILFLAYVQLVQITSSSYLPMEILEDTLINFQATQYLHLKCKNFIRK